MLNLINFQYREWVRATLHVFHRRGPAAARHRSPKLYVRRTTHFVVSAERSRRATGISGELTVVGKISRCLADWSDTGIPRRQSWSRHAVVLVAKELSHYRCDVITPPCMVIIRAAAGVSSASLLDRRRVRIETWRGARCRFFKTLPCSWRLRLLPFCSKKYWSSINYGLPRYQ